MRYITAILLLVINMPAMAFMSGIDPSRDTQGELDIIGATIPLAPASASVNVGYVKFTNSSDKDIEFHKFTSPVFDKIEMHITTTEYGTTKMKQVKSITVPAKSSIELKPGSTHLMLIGPRRALKAGEKILMIAQDSLERRFMLQFTVIDLRHENVHNEHKNHQHHSH